MGQALPIHEVSRSHTTHRVGLLWTSDQPDAETSIWQHTTLTTDRHQCFRCDSNPESQQASGHRLMPQTARPLGPARNCITMLKYRSLRVMIYRREKASSISATITNFEGRVMDIIRFWSRILPDGKSLSLSTNYLLRLEPKVWLLCSHDRYGIHFYAS